jgi:hypothetical protein
MIHPELEASNRALDRDHAERDLIDELVEKFLENEDIKGYVDDTLVSYQLDFDHTGSLTHEQEELVSQYQNLIYVQLVAGMLRRLTGRN